MTARVRITPLWLHRIREREHDRESGARFAAWANETQADLSAVLNAAGEKSPPSNSAPDRGGA